MPSAAINILASLNDDCPSGGVRIFGMDAEKFYPLIHFAVRRSKIQYHDPVLVVLDKICKCCYHLHSTFAGKIASENRIVDSLSEAFHDLVHFLQSSLVHDVVAYNIAVPSAQIESLPVKCGVFLDLAGNDSGQ